MKVNEQVLEKVSYIGVKHTPSFTFSNLTAFSNFNTKDKEFIIEFIPQKTNYKLLTEAKLISNC